jgi:PAS domain S-box-containing protein
MSKILVIDDEHHLRRAVRRALTAGKDEVIETETAEAGVLQARQHLPDLVICDFNLGLGSGLEVLAQLRQTPATAAIPLILITGSDDETVMRRGMDLGADDFLHKPFTGEELLAAVEARLKKLGVLKAQAERALRDIEARHRLLFESSTDAVMVLAPPAWNFVEANAATLRIFGAQTKAEFLAAGPWDVSPERQPDGRPSADQAKAMIEAALRDGSCHFEWTHQRLTGEAFPATVLLARMELAGQTLLQATVRDISGRHRAEQELRKSELRFRTIAQAAFDAIIMMDPDGSIAFWNPAAERIFGYTESEALGRRLHTLLVPGKHHAAHDQAWPHFQKAGQGAALDRTLELTALRKDGTEFPVELSVSGVSLDGRWRAVGIVRDISMQRASTQMLMQERILLRTLIDALPDCIYAKDREARKTLANSADVCSLGAVSEADVLGKTDYDLLDRKIAASCYADDMRVIFHGEAVVNRQELIITPNGQQQWLETTKLPLRNDLGQITGLVGVSRDITERRRAEEQLRKLSFAVEQSPASVVITDTAGRIEYVNPKFCAVTGYQPAEVLGQNPRVLKSGETPTEAYRELWQRLTAGEEWRGEFHNRKKNGELYWEFAVISPIKDDAGNITHFLAVKEDITERKRTEGEREVMELHLRQAQKLESIGQLAAGLAHEINTPMQYIGDNTRFLQDAFGELRRAVGAFQELTKRLRDQPAMAQALSPVEAVLQAADVDYLVAEIPKAIEQSLQGAERVTRIVRAMKEFSHPGTEQKTAVDLNHAIESTVTVARNEWKYVADLATDFDPQLPPVPCLPGEFNQVILNLIINAAHAIADFAGKNSGAKGRITISTQRLDAWAEIRVADTGTGIPEAVRGRIFDPFFTTKPVGQGSGQGLAIARSVIVDKHGGTLTCETELGRGTTFYHPPAADRQRGGSPVTQTTSSSSACANSPNSIR